jgi:hypothetical protein
VKYDTDPYGRKDADAPYPAAAGRDLHVAPPDETPPAYTPALTVVPVPGHTAWHIRVAGEYQATVGPLTLDRAGEWYCTECRVATCPHIAVAQAAVGSGD